MPETYVVFAETDRAAAQLIARKKEFLLYPITGEDDPAVYNPTLDENNLILVGGWYPNPYSRYYFYDMGLVTDDPEKEIMIGKGVYANGKRYIRTIVRPNGTEVTAVFGYHAIDTIEAAYDYVTPKVNLAALVLPLLAATAVGVAWAKKTGRI